MPELSPETVTTLTGHATRIGGVIVLLLVALVASRYARRATQRAFERAQMEATLSKFFAHMVRYMILVVAVLTCLSIFGIETTSFAAVLGAAGLAVGLSLQSSLSNFAAGVLLLTFRPFKVGDTINVSGSLGKVDEIELFTTRLVTPDNRLLILPNASVFGSTIENITAMETRRVEVMVGVVYDADIDDTRRVLERSVVGVEGVLPDPATQIMLNGLGASSVDWLVRVWAETADFWVVRERVLRSVKVELDAAGIGIPFPQVEVHVDPTFRRAAEGLAQNAGPPGRE